MGASGDWLSFAYFKQALRAKYLSITAAAICNDGALQPIHSGPFSNEK